MANVANALIGGITGGMCDSMLGRGSIEFRPAGVVAIGRDGREQPMYRGGMASNGGIDVYVAPASIRRSGDRVRMLDLFDFQARQVVDGKAFLSARKEYEYDCARSRHRMLATTGFSERMGKGAVVQASDAALPWEPVGHSGPAYEHWQLACRRR